MQCCRWLRRIVILSIVLVPSLNLVAAEPVERHIAAGNVDPQRDDSELLQKALNAGPGIVKLGAGTFRCQNVSIPSGVTLVGAGPATILQSRGSAPVFAQKKCRGWAIRDLAIQGTGKGVWKLRDDDGHIGTLVDGCHDYEISGVTLRNFDGAALQITHTNLAEAAFSNGGKLDRVTATDNYAGVKFGVRGEYVTATHLNCSRNLVGCIINAGNTNLSTSNFCGNVDGLILEDRENGSHGTINGCLLNHNERYALRARNVENGMTIASCCFYYGAIELRDCSGINVVNGQINCHVTVVGKSANRFAGNLFVPADYHFRIDPSTLIQDNFTKKGPFVPGSQKRSE